MRQITAAPFIIYTNNTDRMRIDASGNVGIGTTNPVSILHINSENAVAKFTNSASGTTATDGVQFGHVGGGSLNSEMWNYENGYFRIGTNNYERIRILASGSIGINTTTPGQTLTIVGTANITGATYLGNSLCATGQVLTTNSATGLISCTTVASASATVGGSGNSGYIAMWNGTNQINNSKIYQSTNGIGIGTTTVPEVLTVNGNLSASVFYDANNKGYYVDPASTSYVNALNTAGRIGVGTTTVPEVLTVNGNISASVFYDSENKGYYINPSNSATSILTAGNVGIGTTSPSDKLHIVGNVQIQNGSLNEPLFTALGPNLISKADILNGGTNGWLTSSGYSNVIVIGPEGTETVAIYKYLNTSSGLYTDYINVDPTKSYLIEYWIKQNSTSQGTNYLGREEYTSAKVDNDQGNGPYTWNDRPPRANEWYHVYGIIPPYNAGAEGTHSATNSPYTPGTEYKFWSNATTKIKIKIFLSYYGSQNADTWVTKVAIREIGGSYTGTLSVDNGSNVGIGTTTLSQLLTVKGTANITGATYLGNSLCAAGQVLTTNSATGLVSCTSSLSGSVSGSGSSGYIAMWNGTNQINNSIIYQGASGVGIGTTTTNYKLNIQDSMVILGSSPVLRMGSGALSSLSWNSGGATYGTYTFGNAQDIDTQISAGNGTIYIDGTTGNVGIGTTAPDSTLDVHGTVNVTGLTTIGNYSATSSQLIVQGGVSGAPIITLKRNVGATASFSWALSGGGLSFTDDTNTGIPLNLFGGASQVSAYIGQSGAYNYDGRNSLLSATTQSANAGIDKSATNFTIQGGLGTGAGNLGNIYFNTGNTLASGNTTHTSTAKMVILGSGNVGIGTTTPSQKLDVNGNITSTGIVNGSQLCMNGDCRSTWDSISSSSGWSDNGTIVVLTTTTDRVIIGSNTTNNKALSSGSLYVQNDLEVDGNLYGSGADIAENFPTNDKLEPGDVVIIDTELSEGVKKSTTAYSTLVAGVVTTEPGAIFGSKVNGSAIALAGRVPIKVTNENGKINPGDLLTSSSKAGFAMKCESKEKCSGAIIGKALETFDLSEGKIKVLIALG